MRPSRHVSIGRGTDFLFTRQQLHRHCLKHQCCTKILRDIATTNHDCWTTWRRKPQIKRNSCWHVYGSIINDMLSTATDWWSHQLLQMPWPRIELGTSRSSVRRSPNWAIAALKSLVPALHTKPLCPNDRSPWTIQWFFPGHSSA